MLPAKNGAEDSLQLIVNSYWLIINSEQLLVIACYNCQLLIKRKCFNYGKI